MQNRSPDLYEADISASHIKPWRESSNERPNGENGLLLTPSIDHLFDRGVGWCITEIVLAGAIAMALNE